MSSKGEKIIKLDNVKILFKKLAVPFNGEIC